MSNKYEIQLGVKLDTSDIKPQLKEIDGKHKVKLGIDLGVNDIRKRISEYNKNTNNVKLKLGIKLDADDIKKQIKNLDLGGTGKGVAIPISTESLENSLREVRGIITDIKNSLGTLDGGDMKNLLSSVNQIASALDKATDESNGLVKSLSELSKKDFSVNVGLDLGKKGNNNMIAYGRMARKQVIPELEKQAAELEKILGGQQATMKKLSSKGMEIGFDVFTDFDDFNSDSAIKRMEAMEKYVNSMKRLAAIDNIDLSGFNEIHRDASELINDITGVENAVNKAGDIPEKLKNIFGGGVDGDGLSRQLDSIVTDLGEIKTAIQGLSSGASLDGLTASFNRLSETLEKLTANITTVKQNLNGIDNASASVGQSGGGINNLEQDLKQAGNAAKSTADDIKQVSSEARKLNNISIDISDGNIDELRNALRGLKLDDSAIEEVIKELDELGITAKNISGIFKNGNLIKFDIKGIQSTADELERIATITKTLKKGEWIGSEKYSQSIDKAALDSLNQKKNILNLDMANWLKDNSAAAKEFGSRIKELQIRLENCNSVEFDHIKGEFQQIKKEAKLAGKNVQTLGDRLKTQFQRYTAYLSVADLFMWTSQGLRDMFDQVVAIDSAMTELKKVTDETDATYEKFLTNAATRAKEIGTTIDGLVESTADFARLGYDFKDAQGLAEVANIYAVVGDDIDSVETATQSLISTLTAFKDEANGLNSSDFALSIVDKMNEVSNNFAISSGGIGEALQRSASSMMAANNSLDETIALITAANTVVQDPTSVGTAFKTISMRIRGAKTEMEAAGLETEGMVESTAKLRSEILALSGVDIMLNANEFKSTYQIMDELADKWQDLTDIQQASVTELIAGKRQGNIVSSLMNNFNIAEEALETSLDSAGSAMKEHEKWQQSLEAQLLKLKASWQGLSQAFLSSDFLKSALDWVIKLIDGLTKLIDTIGVIPTLFAGIGMFKLGKKGLGSLFGVKQTEADILSDIAQAIGVLGTNSGKSSGLLGKLGSSLRRVTGGATSAGGALKAVGSSLLGLITTHPYVAAAVVAVTALTSAFVHQKKEAEELAKEVEKTVSSYKEQHEELKKLENDYDTSNESSMISRYEKLSRGVDNLGRNVSLTADEYSEYQSIVNSIAEQIPSLITGYDEQGNALLSCKGNVEELTEAYEKLIHAQNQEILSANAGNIEKNWKNTVKQATGYDFWEELGNTFSFDGFFGGTSDDFDMKTDTAEWLSGLTSGTSKNEIQSYLDDNYLAKREIRQALQNAGYDVNSWSSNEDISKVLKNALKNEPEKIKGVLDDYYAGFDEAVAEYKTKASALLSEAFDVSSAISGLNYGNIGEELQAVAHQTVNSLDFDFLTELSESGKTIDQWTKELLNQLNSIGKADNAEIEAAFDLQTKFNGGEISYGQYIRNLENVEQTIDNLNLKSEAKEQLKISLGLDDEGVIDQYNALVKRLTDSKNYDFDISETEARKLLDGLSSEELSVAVGVITDMSNNNYSETAEEIKTAIERELSIRGLSLDLDIEVEKTKLEAVATAISESFSGSGLSSESISAVEGIFSELDSYDSSKLFERTANGIRLNSEEYRKLNSEYKKTNVAKINKEMDSLGDIYNQTREELYRLTYGTDEYNTKASELSGIEQQIKDLEQLAAGYEGLASAYQEWQMAESAGSQRDMYENVIKGLENIDDEISRGWYDDATIEFLELLSGKDLSTAGIEEVKKAYKGLGETIDHTSYKVRDFFTVDEDGNSTNAGVYNFLDAIGQLEEEKFGGKDVVQRKDGKIVGFNFDLVGGDEVIAEALGVSEELVQIMVRAADDAGFVVSMDGTYQQLDVLREKAQEASVTLNNILEKNGKKGFDFNFNSTDVDDITNQLKNAKNILDDFRNTDGTINTKLEGADEALTVASTLQSMLDKLTRPTYMDIEVSQVEDEIQEPLQQLQELRRLTETEHQLKLSGADTSALEESKQEVYNYFEELAPEIKTEIGLVDDKGNPLTGQALKDKLNSGDVSIEATVDIQMEMDEKLGVLVDKALLDAGIIDKKEFKKRVQIYFDADVDNKDAKDKTEKAVKEITGNKNEKASSKNNKSVDSKVKKNIDVEVKTDKVDTSDVKDKTEKTIKDELKENSTIETTVELETTIGEATELIQSLENADKDIVIDVTVKGLDDVKELNKNIDLATEIKGSVDKLSEYVKGAKALSGLDDNISSFVSAEVKGNVLSIPEFELNNLEVFAEGAKKLKGIGSFKSDITANVSGNVIDKFEYKLDNLKVLSDSAKDLGKIGNVESNVKANIKGNVIDEFEYKLDNLKVFTDSAKDIGKIGNVESNVKATVNTGEDGDVIDTFEYKLDNLGKFAAHVKKLQGLQDVDINVTATVNTGDDGDAVDTFEYKLDNLETFADGAKALQGIGNVSSEVTAKVNTGESGDAIDTFEYKLDNLEVFAKGAKALQGIGDVSTTVTAKVNTGNDGDAVDEFEYKLDNLETFAKGAKELQGLQDVDLTVSAKVNTGENGDVADTFEYKLDNLEIFAKAAKELQGLEDVDLSVKATINGGDSGDVTETFEYKLDNLGEFAKHVKALQGLENVDISVKATVDGDVTETAEYKIDNLGEFKKHAKALQGLGDVDITVNANIKGNVPEKTEGYLNDLQVFAKGAKALQNVESKKISITANIYGNVPTYSEGYLDDLQVFAKGAKALQGLSNVDLSVKANADGNVISGDGASSKLSSLTEFKSLVSGMSNQTVTVSVTANVDAEKINQAITLLTNVANSGVFKDYNATVQVGAKIATIDDTVVKNYSAPPKQGKVSYSVDELSPVYTWTAPNKDGVVNYSAEVEALTKAQKNKTGTITYKAKISGFPVVNGTANAKGSAFVNGVAGKAFKQGDWGVKQTTSALTGELGQELVVYGNRYWTVGDNGAEFATIPKGAIVFNHKQTEELFKNGRVTSGGGRGRALANGTAFSDGYGGAGSVGGNPVTGQTYGKSSSSDSSKDKDFEDVIDWIEVIIDRVERAIDKFEQQANNIHKSWSSRNKALLNQISEVDKEIGLQQRAYNEYMNAANGVGLSEDWAEKVRNGEIDIETIKNEDLKEKIDDYQKW